MTRDTPAQETPDSRSSVRAGEIDAGRMARRALLVAGVIITVFFVIEVANAAGNWTGGAWPWKRPVSAVLAFLAAAATLIAIRAVTRDRARLVAIMNRLSASERQSAGIMSIAVDSIITIDEDQRIVVFNHGAEATFGWNAADVVGKPLSLLLPSRVHDVHTRHIKRFAAGADVARRMGQRQEIVGLRHDGTEFPAEASISRLEIPGGRLYTVVLRDITERHRQQKDEQFLANAGAILSASLDYDSTLVSAVNLPVPHLSDCCVLDLRNEDGTTRRIASVHDDPDRTKALRALEYRNKPASNMPFPVARVIDEEMPIEVEPSVEGNGDAAIGDSLTRIGITSATSIPLLARGRLIGVLTLICTEAKRDRDPERLKVAESVAKLIALAIDNAGLYQTAQRATVARDEILGAVSHDLRNPLAAISLCARALSEDAREANRREVVDTITESASMMNRMIQDLLDVATIESGHLRVDPLPQRIEPLVDQVLEMTSAAAQERGIQLRAELETSLPDVLVDPTRLMQVLANLVANAVKFTESGGHVVILAQSQGDRVRVEVRDTGVGIPTDHLPHIFDRHWHSRRTGRTAGTGLGLAIATGIVEAHGGVLSVESTEGVGSTFAFTVPAIRAQVPSRSMP